MDTEGGVAEGVVAEVGVHQVSPITPISYVPKCTSTSNQTTSQPTPTPPLSHPNQQYLYLQPHPNPLHLNSTPVTPNLNFTPPHPNSTPGTPLPKHHPTPSHPNTTPMPPLYNYRACDELPPLCAGIRSVGFLPDATIIFTFLPLVVPPFRHTRPCPVPLTAITGPLLAMTGPLSYHLVVDYFWRSRLLLCRQKKEENLHLRTSWGASELRTSLSGTC
ncbi:hypothetical protein Pmani_034938 [Petrolisthes manimaculis]|uniref:Uncharacterized protein n=1 Tax=Petrolisthes manimaculis TaxID=1843537 RepID=A0AAE1TP60_9EUCA|nr:hypothetical protein Pmani_034938 [Petrolisthes manimaculis]